MAGAYERFAFSQSCVIRSKAEQLEMSEAKKLQLLPLSLVFLGHLFDEVYNRLRPSTEDYETRQTLIDFFDKFAKQKIKGSSLTSSGPSVRAFGSFTMNFFTSESDLDLTVSLGYTGDSFPRENKVQVLRKFVNALYGLQGGGQIHGVEPVLRAIVPVVKFVVSRTGIECDISIENNDGILRSEFIRIFSSIDERFKKLCYLMKAWAKTRDCPILPPFSVFLEAGGGLPEVERRVQPYKQFGRRNQETVPELFITLMCKLLSVESLWKKGLCASTYQGCWISKTFDNKNDCLNVEDFTNRSQNAARSAWQRSKIYQCIRETLSRLQTHLTSTSGVSDLKAFLFGRRSESKFTWPNYM